MVIKCAAVSHEFFVFHRCLVLTRRDRDSFQITSYTLHLLSDACLFFTHLTSFLSFCKFKRYGWPSSVRLFCVEAVAGGQRVNNLAYYLYLDVCLFLSLCCIVGIPLPGENLGCFTTSGCFLL